MVDNMIRPFIDTPLAFTQGELCDPAGLQPEVAEVYSPDSDGEAASVQSGIEEISELQDADPKLLPLAWLARLHGISKESSLRPFREDAREILRNYFGGMRINGSWSPHDAPELAHRIDPLLRSIDRSTNPGIPYAIEDGFVPTPRRWGEQDLAFGMKEAEWRDEVEEHVRELAEHGVSYLLQRALHADEIAFDHPMWLTFSPFAINSEALRALGTQRTYLHPTPIAPLIGDELRIGCFGAGLHDEAAYFETMARRALQREGPYSEFATAIASELEFARRLKGVQQELFGPIAATCYEVREMLALWFRQGERNGEIHVFDTDPRIAASLADPRFAVTNSFDATLRGLFAGSNRLPADLRRFFSMLAEGRSVREKVHGLTQDGNELKSWAFDLDPRELAKIHVHQLDMALEPLPELERFDLSVWLNSHYFFSRTVALLTLAKILHQTKAGGYLLTDYFVRKRTAEKAAVKYAEDLGVRIKAANRSSFVGGNVTSHLVQKVADTEPVTLLANLQSPK